MATSENAFVKFTKVAGVLFLLGFRFCGINGNLASVAEHSSEGFRWQLLDLGSSEPTSETTVRTDETIIPTTEDIIETSSVKEDTTILLTLLKPEDVRNVTDETILNYRLESWYSGHSIAIHLWTCNYDHDEFIHIYTESGYINETLGCQDEWPYSQENEHYKNGSSKYFAGQYDNATAIRFVDNISSSVWVKAWFKTNSTRQSKAKIVVNLYHQDYDTEKNCDSGYFDCYRTYNYCPHCCTDSDQTDRFHMLRCIPLELKCNGRPNCGATFNKDEAYETCQYDEPVCPSCKSFCLSWNYIITSLAIAVLFIVTPTVIVFALFHRRNVALARARLERLTQERMADMRGEFTRDSPLTDLPPSYEEVYETKEPPPCFCQAVAMEGGSEVLQPIQQRIEDISGKDAAEVVDNSSENVNNSNGIQNQAFHCSCNNVGTLSQDPDMNGSNNNSQSVDDEMDKGEV